ncbi:uncharacterized protein LOC141723617 [Apium graveolens]|uniref:uncharacterized protein LOC141723617 n=1 Tax=Apium graveolens TaxID=4045 RepID=UPI003D7BCB0A
MEIKIVIVVAVICTLISVSSAVPGTGSFRSNFTGIAAQQCPKIKDFGKFYAAVNPNAMQYTCGQILNIQCKNKPYCKNNSGMMATSNPIAVKVVDKCIPGVSTGENDLLLSQEAFQELAITDQYSIEIEINI